MERKLCSVYLILNAERFKENKIEIEAYFTLSHKCLNPENISKSKIKKISGFKNSEYLHFVLIGQLGKYIEKNKFEGCKCAGIRASDILDYAFEVIRASSHLIPCRCVLVECKEELQKVYFSYGFVELQYDNVHYQMIKSL